VSAAQLETKLALLKQELARRQTTLGAIRQQEAEQVRGHATVASSLSLGYIRQAFDSKGRLTSSGAHVLNLASHTDTPWSLSSSTCAFSATPSPDGTMLAYDAYLHGVKTSNDPSTCNGPESLVIEGARTITFAALATNQFYDSLAWSPDGTKLVVTRITYNSSGTWTASALLICTIASESCAAIPGGGVGAGYASYSPDGTHLVFDPAYLTTTNYLAVMTTDGGNVVDYPATGVASVSDPQNPSFSPDGTTIIFADVNAKLASNVFRRVLGTKVVSELAPIGPYFLAEPYHQQYLSRGGRFGSPQSAAKGCKDPIRCYG
jgi:hypothetical protein